MKSKTLICSLLIFLSGCAYVEPLVSQFNIISPAEEAKIGTLAQTEISRQMKVVSGTSDEASVREIGAKLVAALPKQEFNYKFYVVDDPTPNAFTIPGGSIYVHTGLIKLAGGDRDEIAGVMAHELGHAYARHPAKGMSRQYGVEYLSNMLFKGNQSQLKQLSLQLAQQSLLTRYGRGDEFEADQIGYYLLGPAGFRQDGLIRFFQKLQKASKTGTIPAFLNTHPPTPERIARLEALAQGQNASQAAVMTRQYWLTPAQLQEQRARQAAFRSSYRS